MEPTNQTQTPSRSNGKALEDIFFDTIAPSLVGFYAGVAAVIAELQLGLKGGAAAVCIIPLLSLLLFMMSWGGFYLSFQSKKWACLSSLGAAAVVSSAGCLTVVAFSWAALLAFRCFQQLQ